MSKVLALAGNPNASKTTLFNALAGTNQTVGNWPGVIVGHKEGHLKKDKDVIITDLPGIYSLSPYTQEEVVARNYILDSAPDVIVDIVDGSNLERNLYLTTQLLEVGVPVVVAINMMDVVRKNGDMIDTEKLAAALGVRVVEISALKGEGIDKLVAVATSDALDPASYGIYAPGVPSAVASRTIENINDRRITIMTTTFMPCSAKIPVIVLISSAVFGGVWWVAPSAYFMGMAVILCTGTTLKKTRFFAGEATPFVMELPSYHVPTAGYVARSVWERCWAFIKKAFTILLVAFILIWLLSNFGFANGAFGMVEDQNFSILAAWVVAFWVFQFGGIAAGEVSFGAGTVVAIALAAAFLFLLLRPNPNDKRERAASVLGVAEAA